MVMQWVTDWLASWLFGQPDQVKNLNPLVYLDEINSYCQKLTYVHLVAKK